MQALEFFFFAILIGIVTAVFAVMSFFYKYVDLSTKAGSKSGSGASTPPTLRQDESSALVMDKGSEENGVRANYTSETEGVTGTSEFPKDSPSESEF